MSEIHHPAGDILPFSYDLPPARIAQRPVHPPESARMLVVDRKSESLSDATFKDIPDLLTSRDHIVFNDTAVIPARLFGRIDGYDREVEVLLLSQLEPGTWLCIGRPMKKLRTAPSITFTSLLRCTSLPCEDPERAILQFHTNDGSPVDDAMRACGTMPIPPYIRDGHGDEEDLTDYQAIFARVPGSIAAPTASLHFTNELVERIKERGALISYLTLHVGAASFLPVLRDGVMRPPGSESIAIPPGLIDALRATRQRGGRVIAVGTTVVRALESAALCETEDRRTTDLFIRPGHHFGLVDCVVTNFHQPGTTHLLLVESLLGRDLLSKTYSHALTCEYRFLSYGDGMLIV